MYVKVVSYDAFVKQLEKDALQWYQNTNSYIYES